MNFSIYQEAIFRAAEETNENLIINAVAGSGKTTTLVELVKRLKGSTLFLAFNKPIAQELQSRGVNASTINAFGWRICQENSWPKLDARKNFNLFQKLFDQNDQRFWKWQSAATQLMGLFKAHLIYEPRSIDIDTLADQYGIDLPEHEQFRNMLLDAFERGKELLHIMDFDDQIFFPLLMNWAIPQVDNILVDELQDTSPMNQELIVRAGKRIIGVGDVHQAIYGFRGADVDAIPNMQKRLKAKVLPLSISYRCPKLVVLEAQKIVSHIESSPTAPDGKVERVKLEDFRKQAVSDDYVICRCTAPLVSECLRMIREGKKATVKGRDIGQQILTLIEKIGTKGTMEDFLDRVEMYSNEQLTRLSRLNKEAEIIALTDKIDTIKVLCETIDLPTELKAKIDSIFKDEVSGIVFCTVHKAKGLEADRVFILEPKLMPHPNAKLPWQKTQEMNLKYVAITRAKKELLWIQ